MRRVSRWLDTERWGKEEEEKEKTDKLGLCGDFCQCLYSNDSFRGKHLDGTFLHGTLARACIEALIKKCLYNIETLNGAN